MKRFTHWPQGVLGMSVLPSPKVTTDDSYWFQALHITGAPCLAGQLLLVPWIGQSASHSTLVECVGHWSMTVSMPTKSVLLPTKPYLTQFSIFRTKRMTYKSASTQQPSSSGRKRDQF